ncbi:MAG: hypothetical protein R3264_05595, partial [Anaerolineae bacterium]|nr:hypothetical protein [Anaerolineae bacterium]
GTLWIRLGGLEEALSNRVDRIKDFLNASAGSSISEIEVIAGAEDAQLWLAVQEFDWVPEGWGIIKVPLTPARIFVLEERLDGRGARRRYSAGGNLAWVGWPPDPAEAAAEHDLFNIPDSILTRIDLPGLVLQGPTTQPFIGLRAGEALLQRVKQALDPEGRFLGY